MKKRNKTSAIFSGYHVPHLGGIERYTDNLAKKLVENGYKVIVVSSNYDFKDEVYKKENADGFELRGIKNNSYICFQNINNMLSK